MPYVAHTLAKAGSPMPGVGDAVSAMVARGKSEDLLAIQIAYFQNSGNYDGSDIAEGDCLKAIQYARSKKLTKFQRKTAIAGVKGAGFVVGAATGATIGSIVPVAGTAAGGVVGGVAVGTAVSVTTTFFDRTKRFGKFLYKNARGTQGVHRGQAAHALVYCWAIRAGLPDGEAATDALEVILQDEYDEYVAMGMDQLQIRTAERLKSN